MAYDEGAAEVIRAAIGPRPGLSEKKMFGGLCFLLDGNMLAGVHGLKAGGGAMFRVGPKREDDALALPGTRPMQMTGRRMRGFVDVAPEYLEDPETMSSILDLALAYIATLPPK